MNKQKNQLKLIITSGLTVIISVLIIISVAKPVEADALLTGMTASSYTVPAGWALLKAEGFESGSLTDGESFWGGANTESLTNSSSHSGGHSMDTYVTHSYQGIGMKLNGDFVNSRDIYLSWWQYAENNNPGYGLAYTDWYMMGRDNGLLIADWQSTLGWPLGAENPAQMSFFAQGENPPAQPNFAIYEHGPFDEHLGEWVQYEVHLKANDPGADNGDFEIYANGVLWQQVNKYTISDRCPTFNGVSDCGNFTGNVDVAKTDLWVGGDWGSIKLDGSNQNIDACVGGLDPWSNQTYTAQQLCPPNGIIPHFHIFIDDVIVLRSTSTPDKSSDITPPSVPAGLTATAVSPSKINLSWASSTDAVGVTGYSIYRGGVRIAKTTSSSYSNTGLSASTLYSYTVAAYDAAGNISASSTVATATTLAPSTYTVGGTISGLNGTAVLQNNVGDNLTVSANGSFTFATAFANSASYAVAVLTNTSGQTCVVANGSGIVAAANVITVAVTCTNKAVTTLPAASGGGGDGLVAADTTPPGIPTNFVASTSLAGVIIAWINPLVSDFAGVKLIRKRGSAPTGINDSATQLVYQGKNQTYRDTSVNLASSTVYYSIATYDTHANYSALVTIAVSLNGHSSTVIIPVNTANPSVSQATSTFATIPTAIVTQPVITPLVVAPVGVAASNETIVSETDQLITQSAFVNLTPIEKTIYAKTITVLGSAAIDQQNKYNIANFIHCGTPSTVILGAGERGATINSYATAYGHLPATSTDWQDVVRIANGRWPVAKNSDIEAKAKAQFKQVYLRQPNLANAKDDAAVTVIAYGLRPAKRNLNNEKIAIKSFQYIYKRIPTSAFDWNIVRAISYSGAKR
jgi:hypothetical protein